MTWCRISSIVVAAIAVASSPATAQTLPPVRPLGPVLRVSGDSLASVATAIPLPDGRVFVNDIVARRVLLFDSTLAKAIVVADSTGATANAYGPRLANLISFHGDSVLLITAASLSMQVLTPAGTIGRVMAMPGSGSGGITSILGLQTPSFDGRGRIAYRLQARPQLLTSQPAPTEPKTVNEFPDSAVIVRYDLVTRKVDTAAWFRTPKNRNTTFRDGSGRMTGSEQTVFPFSVVDDWAVTPDGSIVFARGRDYHLDRLNPDGTWTSLPKIPFEWERLSDDRKIAIIDSAVQFRQAQTDSLFARMRAAAAGGGAGGAPVVATTGGGAGAGGGGGDVVVITRGGGEGRGGGGGGGAPLPAGFTMPPAPVMGRPSLADLPDYVPPFLPASVRADRDGNLWIRTTKMVNGRPVYDIVNPQGELIDRVQLPQFRTIAGFGPGVIYMAVIDSARVVHLERARVKQDS